MNSLKPETVAAIKADEFASKTIEAVIELVYLHWRDWNVVTRTGKIPFTDDNAAVAYLALCMLVDRTQRPDVDAEVRVGATMMPVGAVHALDESLSSAFSSPA